MIRLDLENMLNKRNRTKYWLIQKLESNYPTINALIDGTAPGIKFDTLDKILYYLDCELEDLVIYKKTEPKKRD